MGTFTLSRSKKQRKNSILRFLPGSSCAVWSIFPQPIFELDELTVSPLHKRRPSNRTLHVRVTSLPIVLQGRRPLYLGGGRGDSTQLASSISSSSPP